MGLQLEVNNGLLLRWLGLLLKDLNKNTTCIMEGGKNNEIP